MAHKNRTRQVQPLYTKAPKEQRQGNFGSKDQQTHIMENVLR